MYRNINIMVAVLTFVLLGATISFSQTAVQPAGGGTSSDPYLIATLDNLYWVTQHSGSWSSCFKQTADIDASSDSSWSGGKGFPPIGINTNTPFSGTYDGAGHTISGIYISVDSTDWIGVFGFCQYGSQPPVIDSLGVIDERIVAGSDDNAGDDIGGLVGAGLNITITDCYTTGSVSGSNAVGGLIGYGSSATVSECYTADRVNGSNGNIGGLVGENMNSSIVTNCFSSGSVGGTGSNSGGLIGFNNSTVSYSYSAGSVHVSSFNVGGFIGADISGSPVDSCFWNSDSSGSTGIGNGTAAGAAAETAIQLKDPFTFTDAGWDTSYWYMGDSINSGYPYLNWQNPGGAHLVTAVAPSVGTGAPDSPYEIASLDNLYWVTQNSGSWDLWYEQVSNIDASQTSGWNSGAGFLPIGNGTTVFDGNYDGEGHTISGLCISRASTDYVGLFGLNDGTIDSLGLVDENISGQNDVGGLAGYSQTSISDCYSTGTVTSGGSTGRIGGLVGTNVSGNMSDDYSAASVAGQTLVGGLVGYNVNALPLVPASISNCYSIGSVSASDHVGGLVGENEGSGFPGSAFITHSYSVGSVTATGGSPNYAGGLVGASLDDASTDSSFWDTATSGQATSSGGTAETDAAMMMMSTFSDSGWDFTNTWSISAGINNGYPYLRSFSDHSLAVQATGFLATSAPGSVTLTWQTQSEVNNAGFMVEKQQPGVSNWQAAGSYKTDKNLEGLGTSSSGRSYSFTDDKVVSGKTYNYKIQSVSTDGTTKDLSTLTVTVDEPKNYALYQNYPNPFNPTTTIRFDLKEQSNVTLEVFDILGQKVMTENFGTMEAGRFNEVVNMDRFGTGLYFYRLVVLGNKGEEFVSIKKFVLIK